MRLLTASAVFLGATLCAWASKGSFPESGRFLKDTTGFFDALHVDRNFNTSFSVNIPLFTVTVPGYGRGSPTPGKLNALNIGNLALLGIVLLGGLALFYPALVSPISYARSFGDGYHFGDSLVGIPEFLLSKVDDSLDGLPSFPGLHPQDCIKRAICEANHHPKKYGIIGLIIQVIFPPYNETRIQSKYHLAARKGRHEKAKCGSLYDGCMFNFLELLIG